jgi:hypothetical protein
LAGRIAAVIKKFIWPACGRKNQEQYGSARMLFMAIVPAYGL